MAYVTYRCTWNMDVDVDMDMDVHGVAHDLAVEEISGDQPRPHVNSGAARSRPCGQTLPARTSRPEDAGAPHSRARTVRTRKRHPCGEQSSRWSIWSSTAIGRRGRGQRPGHSVAMLRRSRPRTPGTRPPRRPPLRRPTDAAAHCGEAPAGARPVRWDH
eukprot:7047533-Prymnesium_polylepis.1